MALLSLCLATSAHASTGQTPVFYVAAHADDIQFFIGNQAVADASNTSVRSIWVIATAGNGDGSTNIWMAREAGALASMEAALGWFPGSIPSGCYHTRDTPTINGHSITRYKLFDASGNERSVMYCLRLPSGEQTGNGYASYSYQSLFNLLISTPLAPIYTVDGATSYTSISDIMYTLDTLMTNERNDTDPTVHPWLNANEYSGMRNLNDGTDDHVDHRVLGSILASFAYHNGYNRCWWVSYTVHTGGGDTSVTGTALANKSAVYRACTSAVDTMLAFLDGQTYPSGQNWSFGGSSELAIHTGWEAEWTAYGPYEHYYTRTYSTADTGNNYPLTYP